MGAVPLAAAVLGATTGVAVDDDVGACAGEVTDDADAAGLLGVLALVLLCDVQAVAATASPSAAPAVTFPMKQRTPIRLR
jgi:hypothetical protein